MIDELRVKMSLVCYQWLLCIVDGHGPAARHYGEHTEDGGDPGRSSRYGIGCPSGGYMVLL